MLTLTSFGFVTGPVLNPLLGLPGEPTPLSAQLRSGTLPPLSVGEAEPRGAEEPCPRPHR